MSPSIVTTPTKTTATDEAAVIFDPATAIVEPATDERTKHAPRTLDISDSAAPVQVKHVRLDGKTLYEITTTLADGETKKEYTVYKRRCDFEMLHRQLGITEPLPAVCNRRWDEEWELLHNVDLRTSRADAYKWLLVNQLEGVSHRTVNSYLKHFLQADVSNTETVVEVDPDADAQWEKLLKSKGMKELKAKVEEQGEKIEELEARIKKQDEKIEELEAKDAEQDEKIEELETKDAEQDEKIEELEAKDAEQDEKIEELEAKDAEQDEKIEELEAKDTEQDEKIEELEAKDAEQDEKIEELEARIEELEKRPPPPPPGQQVEVVDNLAREQITQLTTRLKKQISDLKAKDAEQDKEISGLKAKDAAQGKLISGLKLKDAEHDKMVEKLKGKDAEQDKMIAELKAGDKVLDVKIGQKISELRDLLLGRCNELEEMLEEQVADISQRFLKPDKKSKKKHNGPRCNDGTLDMRFKVNFGKDKFRD